MHLFFGLNHHTLKSQLQIPIFETDSKNSSINKKLTLYKCFVVDKKWIVEKVNIKDKDEFFILNAVDITNKNNFFLAEDNIIDYFDNSELKSYSILKHRANFKIEIQDGGFSSYQSDFPFAISNKKGSIVSSIYSLTNYNADQNYLLFKNIYFKPIEEKFNGYFVNYKTKMIEHEFELITNQMNCIEIDKKFIKPENFFVTDKYLGIPLYLSIKDKNLSFEHTLPLPEYIHSKNKFEIVKKLKEKICEIIN
ncbi:hypothetical protein N8796_03160 [Candidatus Pelagibacter sp.]|nr:hypothetical protein [Candidatus Pelagibacter sp.]